MGSWGVEVVDLRTVLTGDERNHRDSPLMPESTAHRLRRAHLRLRLGYGPAALEQPETVGYNQDGYDQADDHLECFSLLGVSKVLDSIIQPGQKDLPHPRRGFDPAQRLRRYWSSG
jgi:hypothetical protein